MRLYLVRHGKAERNAPSGRDEDRTLQPRGIRQARWLAETIARGPQGDRPALILTSPAARARQTAELINEELGCELRLEPALMLGEPVEDAIGLIVEACSGGCGPLMLVGHNPMMEILLPALVPGLAPEESEMRTGMAAVIEAPAGTDPREGCRLIGLVRYPG